MHSVARIGGILGVNIQRLPVGVILTRLQYLQSARSFYKSTASHSGRHLLLPLEIVRKSSGRTKMENGFLRQKRKGSPVNSHDRPSKQLKPARANTTNSDQSIDSQYMYGSDSIADAMVEPMTATGENAEWQATIEQVVKNVVSIHFCLTCSFDTSSALSSEATGFVVDAAKGFILTNRHVVGSGPFWGYCIFDNHEEVRQRTLLVRLRLTADVVRRLPCLSRPGPRLRYPSLRSNQNQVHASLRASATSGSCQGRI